MEGQIQLWLLVLISLCCTTEAKGIFLTLREIQTGYKNGSFHQLPTPDQEIL